MCFSLPKKNTFHISHHFWNDYVGRCSGFFLWSRMRCETNWTTIQKINSKIAGLPWVVFLKIVGPPKDVTSHDQVTFFCEQIWGRFGMIFRMLPNPLEGKNHITKEHPTARKPFLIEIVRWKSSLDSAQKNHAASSRRFFQVNTTLVTPHAFICIY